MKPLSNGTTFHLRTQNLVVLSRSPPRMMVAISAQRAMVASVVCCEGTELARELVLDTVPSSWPPTVGVAMWLVSKVVSLANVDGPVVVSAV
jgi:hypothetical protein